MAKSRSPGRRASAAPHPVSAAADGPAPAPVSRASAVLYLVAYGAVSGRRFPEATAMEAWEIRAPEATEPAELEIPVRDSGLDLTAEDPPGSLPVESSGQPPDQ